MKVVSISDAASRLRELVERAASGEDVAITLDGVTVVRLTRLAARKRPLRFGLLQGRVVVPPEFDEPLPSDVLKRFGDGTPTK